MSVRRRYPSVSQINATGTIELDLNSGCNGFMISIKTESEIDPENPNDPLTDNVEGTFTFDVIPYKDSVVSFPYEPVFTSKAGQTRQTIDLSSEARTFPLEGFYLRKLRVIPSAEITNPYTVVVQQEML